MAAAPGAGRHGRSRGFYRALRGSLTTAAERTFQLDTPRADGTTQRQHLLSANQQRGGVLSAELQVDVPAAGAELWQLFLALSRTRRSGMSAQAFTWVDIQAWCALNRVQLTTWELDTLLDMDGAAMSALATIRAEDAASNRSKT